MALDADSRTAAPRASGRGAKAAPACNARRSAAVTGNRAHRCIGHARPPANSERDAVDQLTRASQEFIGQGSRIADALTELGRTYEAQGDRTRADEAFRRALDTDPQAAEAYFFYARFLGSDRRSREKARITAAKYLELEPRGEHAAEAQTLAH